MELKDHEREPSMSSKKVYGKPHLEVYGDLGEITRGPGTKGTRDASGNDGSGKTHS